MIINIEEEVHASMYLSKYILNSAIGKYDHETLSDYLFNNKS